MALWADGLWADGLWAPGLWSADTAVAPTITTTALNALQVGVSFSQQLVATGDAPITWTGTAPDGLTLSSAGLLSGTPTTVGAYSFTVTATNAEGADTQLYTGSIVVAAPVITTTALTAMQIGVAFSQTLVATGEGVTWSGSVPAGLALSAAGALTGTPTTYGAYSFTVTATNAGGSDTQLYTGTVAVAPVVPTSSLSRISIETDAMRLAMLQAVGGLTIRARHGYFVGVFGDDYLGVGDGTADVESSSPQITCRSSDVTRLRIEKNERLTVDDEYYVVVGHRPDGTGITLLQVHRE